MAKLIFNYSAMNSGKTIDLIRTAYNYYEYGLKTLILKPAVDTKGGDYIETRIGLSRRVDIIVKENDSIIELLKNKTENISLILVDEAQFLSENQIKELFIFSNVYDIPVICYGLRTNFKGKLFNGSKMLLALADELNELKTLCSCGNIARFNARKLNDEYVTSGNEVVIDGSSEYRYEPLCSKCFTEKVLLKNKKLYKKIKEII